jgi:hypothetical protein
MEKFSLDASHCILVVVIRTGLDRLAFLIPRNHSVEWQVGYDVGEIIVGMLFVLINAFDLSVAKEDSLPFLFWLVVNEMDIWERKHFEIFPRKVVSHADCVGIRRVPAVLSNYKRRGSHGVEFKFARTIP